MPLIKFSLAGDSIALCDLLKCAGLAASAGQGKHLVAEGRVRVDGRPEARKTARIRPGQLVECGDGQVLVVGAAAAAPPGAAV